MTKPKKDEITVSFSRCSNPDCPAYHLRIEGDFLGDLNIPMDAENWWYVVDLITDTLEADLEKLH